MADPFNKEWYKKVLSLDLTGTGSKVLEETKASAISPEDYEKVLTQAQNVLMTMQMYELKL